MDHSAKKTATDDDPREMFEGMVNGVPPAQWTQQGGDDHCHCEPEGVLLLRLLFGAAVVIAACSYNYCCYDW